MASLLDFDGETITVTSAKLVEKTYKGKSSQAALLETSVGSIVSQSKEAMALANSTDFPATVTVKVIPLAGGRKFVKLTKE